jgi:hypothetical protein
MKQYYRSIVPICLLNLIGEFAGTGNAKLVFTITKKRKFLGDIIITCPYRNGIWNRKLKFDSWIPTSFVSPFLCELILQKLAYSQNWNKHDNTIPVYMEFIAKVETLFKEVNNYTLMIPI